MEKVENNDINLVPDSESSRNILNILNDYCLQKVFRELKIMDFQNVANVCTRFRENAKMCLPIKFKTFYIDDYEYISDYGLPIHRVKNFIRIFGHLLESILWNYPSAPKHYYETSQSNYFKSLNLKVPDNDDKRKADFDRLRENLLSLIIEYCGKTLIEFKMAGYHKLNLTLLSELKALNCLELHDLTIYGNGSFPELCSLKAAHLQPEKNTENLDWFCQSFSKLDCAEFYYLNNLTNDTIIKFQSLNPQLKVLLVSGCKIDTKCFRNIGTRTPNLIGLDCRISGISLEHSKRIDIQQAFQNIFDLKQLKKLNYFRLPRDIYMANASISTFNKHNIPIEHIYSQALDSKILLNKLNNLKQLTVAYCSYIQVIEVMQKLPQLEQLHILSFYNYNLRIGSNTKCIRKFLQNGKNLKEFSIKICNGPSVRFGQNHYNSILAIAKDKRIKVNIYFEPRTIINLNENILNSNREWLDVSHD